MRLFAYSLFVHLLIQLMQRAGIRTINYRLADMQRLNEGYFLKALMSVDGPTAKEALGLLEGSDFHSGLRSIFESIQHLVTHDEAYDLPAVLTEVQSRTHAARNGQLLADLFSVDADPLRLYQYGSALASAGFREHLIASAEDDRRDAISGDLVGLFERKQQPGIKVNEHRERLNAIRSRAAKQPVTRMQSTGQKHLRVVGRESRTQSQRHVASPEVNAEADQFRSVLAHADDDYIAPMGRSITRELAAGTAARDHSVPAGSAERISNQQHR